MHEKIKGFIPVMLTPFKDNGEVDYDGLGRLTDFYIKSGASGLFANCLSSEMFELSEAERLSIVRHIVKCAGGAVPVAATSTFGGSIGVQADFVKRMYDTGVDTAIVITNMLGEEEDTEEKFEAELHKLMDQTSGVPLGLYECPDPYKRVLSAGALRRLVETGRIFYHKDTCLDLGQVRAKLESTVDFPQFGLYDAYMVHAVDSLRAGSAGLSCIQGNYYPELVVWLCQHVSDPAFAQEVDLVQQFFIDHMDVMHHCYPIVAKYFLQKRGLDIGMFTRREVGHLGAAERQGMEQLSKDYVILSQKVEFLQGEKT